MFSKLNSNKRLYLFPVLLLLLTTLYTNTISVSNPHFDFEIGPSPRSTDYHNMFNTSFTQKWNSLPGRLNWFHFHPLSYLRKVGIPTDNGDSQRLNVTNNAYLSGTEALKAARVMRQQNLRISTSVGQGLGYGDTCRTFKDAKTAAKAAARFEYNQLTVLRQALAHEGQSIERLYLDGPFLRVLKYAKKMYSCANFRHGTLGQVSNASGRLPAGRNGAVSLVHEYIKELKNLFPRTQIFITFNIVNWKQDDLEPYFGTSAFDFADVFGLYLQNYYRNGRDYRLNGIQFDAPYGIVTGDISGFRRRIVQVIQQLRSNVSHHNTMAISFLVNSDDHYQFDQRLQRTGFFYQRPTMNNKYSGPMIPLSQVCSRESNPAQRSRCLQSDSRYYQESSHYGNILKNLVLNDPVINASASILFSYQSWHVSPMRSVLGNDSYLDYVTGEVPRILGN